jgi:glycosyltransferase involved in cell wall biosynthesis
VHFVFTTLGYYPESIGGAFRYVAELAEGLAARGHRVEAIFPSEKKEALADRNGVALHRLSIERGPFWRNWIERNAALRDTLREIRKNNPRAIVVSCHGYFARAATGLGGPVVSLFTGPWANEFLQSEPSGLVKAAAPIMRRVERGGLQRSAAIFTISKYYQRSLSTWHPGLKAPVHVIQAGVNAQEFKAAGDRENVRRQFGLASNAFVFLAVRRLEPRMGLLDLINAFEHAAPEFPNAQLWIGGTGAMREKLKERVLQSCGRVKLLGFIPPEELPLRYAAADCTVVPSLDLEGFGLATVESLACGAPVIGSRRGATPEVLEPLANELLFESLDELAGKMRTILNRSLPLPSREACRAYAVSRYNWSGPIEQFERVCAELFAGGSA